MYKIISDNKVIDVVSQPKFIRFLQFGHIALTDKTSAQGIVGSDNEAVYSFIEGNKYPIVSVKEINAIEFERLSSLLGSGEEISANITELNKAKQSKISTISGICKNKITNGFSLEFSDGKVHNFKLTAEDQLNLMQIENQLALGEEFFVYHATNQPCKIYTKEDMLRIIQAFRKHVLYHTTYFNTAKQYINSLVDIEKVNLFSYGMDISEYVENVVLKQILKNGGA